MTDDRHPIRNDPAQRYSPDCDLCRSISDGSLSSWHRFLSQYSGLIFNVIRRHMYVKDEDEIRNVFVDIIEMLYNGDIANYRGESSLSTWLVVYTRCRVIDHTRKSHGRQRSPKGFDDLSEFDKCVLRNYFIERLPIAIVIHMLQWNGFEASAEDIIEAAERINQTIGQRYLKKIDDEWIARRHDMDTGKLLRFMLEMRREQEAKARGNRPDAELLRREAEETAEKVRAALSHLDPLERKIIHLHFDRSWPARRIAETLGMKNQRNAYYRIKRAIEKLKDLLDIDER